MGIIIIIIVIIIETSNPYYERTPRSYIGFFLFLLSAAIRDILLYTTSVHNNIITSNPDTHCVRSWGKCKNNNNKKVPAQTACNENRIIRVSGTGVECFTLFLESNCIRLNLPRVAVPIYIYIYINPGINL